MKLAAALLAFLGGVAVLAAADRVFEKTIPIADAAKVRIRAEIQPK